MIAFPAMIIGAFFGGLWDHFHAGPPSVTAATIGGVIWFIGSLANLIVDMEIWP